MTRRTVLLAGLVALALPVSVAQAQEMTDARLGVRPAVTGLTGPTSIAFLGPNELLVTEKGTGRVKHVVDGQSTVVLDLAVNSASERGLLGIALHPNFPTNPGVYLYWTCRTFVAGPDNFTPAARECDESQMLGADTGTTLMTPLLGNRVDRFVWDAEAQTLTFDKHLLSLRSFQADGAPVPPDQGDANQNAAGNHNGGVIRFGPDGKLYVIMGDNGRRGFMQNLPCGPTPLCQGPFRHVGPTVFPDDQFGGPEPDGPHLTGFVLRINDDGSVPPDNPFFGVGNSMHSEAGDNLKKVYALGIRNSFGLAFDPVSGELWEQENGDDSFDEINRVERGMNGGWVQIAGPLERVAQFKEIETTFGARALQQLRWPPTNIANSPAEVTERLRSTLPMAHYSDPEFAWKWAVPPGGIGFVDGNGLGEDFAGDLFVGGATQGTMSGHLFRFKLDKHRRAFVFDDPRLNDRVADNLAKGELTESESLLIGRNFGIITDIQTGPDGHLYAVSTNRGTIYEIFPN